MDESIAISLTNYNKLVRDNIPEILQEKGKEFVGHTANNREEFFTKLKEKLQEEVNEFLERPCAEEIADIHYNIDTINENELMEYTPRINKEELLYKLEKRKEFKYWKKGNNTSYMYWMPNPSYGLGMIH